MLVCALVKFNFKALAEVLFFIRKFWQHRLKVEISGAELTSAGGM